MEPQPQYNRPWPHPAPRDLTVPAGMRRDNFHAMGTPVSLLDPRSGLPARSGLWSVSGGAPTCAWAEVAAKVACILGPNDGVDFLQAWGLPGLLVEESGACRTTGGWPTPAWEEYVPEPFDDNAASPKAVSSPSTSHR